MNGGRSARGAPRRHGRGSSRRAWLSPDSLVVADVRAAAEAAPALHGPGRPNILLIMTDDQRADGTMDVMPQTRSWFETGGTKFTQAFATTPGLLSVALVGLLRPLRAQPRRPHQRRVAVAGPALHDPGVPQAERLPHGLLRQVPERVEPVPQPAVVRRLVHRDRRLLRRSGSTRTASSRPSRSTRRRTSGTTRCGSSRSRRARTRRRGSCRWRRPRRMRPSRRSRHTRTRRCRPSTSRRTTSRPTSATSRCSSRTRTTTPAAIESARVAQLRTLMSVDDLVGDVFSTLQATGETSSTLAIFMSDNGLRMGRARARLQGRPLRRVGQGADVHAVARSRGRGRDRYAARRQHRRGADDRDAVGGLGVVLPMDGRTMLDAAQSRSRLLLEWFASRRRTRTGLSLRTPTSHYIEHYDLVDNQTIRFREYYDLTTTLGDEQPARRRQRGERPEHRRALGPDSPWTGPAAAAPARRHHGRSRRAVSTGR